MDVENKVFLSHASTDRPLANLLKKTLILGGLPETRIFYSSNRSSGVPTGENWRMYLQRSLRESGLVIELLSHAFISRPICLMELGGAWTLDKPTYPIVIPPLDRDGAVRQIGDVHLGLLGTDADVDDIFDELNERLAETMVIRTNTGSWNSAVRDFKSQFREHLTPLEGDISAEKIVFSNYSISRNARGQNILYLEATNNDSRVHSAIVRATFYNASGVIIASARQTMSQLPAGSTRTLSFEDVVPEHKRYKVDVDMLL